jgi:hypothetical protein
VVIPQAARSFANALVRGGAGFFRGSIFGLSLHKIGPSVKLLEFSLGAVHVMQLLGTFAACFFWIGEMFHVHRNHSHGAITSSNMLART